MLTEITLLSIVLGCISATLVTCFQKWQWFDYYEYWQRPWMPKRCEFCAGFWLSVIMALLYIAVLGGTWFCLIAPFAAASITKKLTGNEN